MFIKEFSVHLPALTTASIEINDLVELEPTIFQNMINLECLLITKDTLEISFMVSKYKIFLCYFSVEHFS